MAYKLTQEDKNKVRELLNQAENILHKDDDFIFMHVLNNAKTMLYTLLDKYRK